MTAPVPGEQQAPVGAGEVPPPISDDRLNELWHLKVGTPATIAVRLFASVLLRERDAMWVRSMQAAAPAPRFSVYGVAIKSRVPGVEIVVNPDDKDAASGTVLYTIEGGQAAAPAAGQPREGCAYLATGLCNKCGQWHGAPAAGASDLHAAILALPEKLHPHTIADHKAGYRQACRDAAELAARHSAPSPVAGSPAAGEPTPADFGIDNAPSKGAPIARSDYDAGCGTAPDGAYYCNCGRCE